MCSWAKQRILVSENENSWFRIFLRHCHSLQGFPKSLLHSPTPIIFWTLSLCVVMLEFIPCRTLWGSWAPGFSGSPISLILGNSLHPASMPFPEFQWADSSSLGKGEDARPGRNKLSRAALGQDPVSPSKDALIISLSYFSDTVTPPRWEKLMINSGRMPIGMQTPDQLDLNVDYVDSYLPHHQPIRRMSMS